ncbi:MAG TPA: SpoIIE family protein phosphatase [Candidatus Polarisedimenticolaceae bacterium]|nr:SpoIIE family protein phosphatase [Candidatus Polarisedimenticolaceae bacterium]
MTDTSTPRRIPAGVLYAAYALLLLWALCYRIPYTIDVVQFARDPHGVPATPFTAEWPAQRIIDVPKDIGTASQPPLMLGDRVVSIDGAPYRIRADVARRVAAKRSGDTIEVGIERRRPDGTVEPITSVVTLGPVPDVEGVLPFRIVLVVLGLLLPWLCFGLGFWVVLARPRDPMAWLVLLMLLGLSHAGAPQQSSYHEWSDPLRISGAAYRTFFGTTWAIWLPLFGVFFAERLPAEQRHPWVKWIVLGPLALVSLRSVAFAFVAAADLRGAYPIFEATAWLDRFSTPLAMASVGTFFLIMGWKKGVVVSADARRRIGLLIWGGAVAFTPLLVLIITIKATGKDVNELPWPLTVPALVAIAVFPITLAYVILVDRAMDARVAVRQGLKYAATRGAIRVLVFAILMIVAWTAYRLVSDPKANRPRQIQAIALGMAAVLVVPRGAERLFKWTDRKFFREAYDAEQVLTELSDEVRTIVDTDTLLDTVLGRIGTTLHIERLAVYLREGDGFVPSRSRGYEALPQVTVNPLVENLRAVAATGKAIRVRHDDPESPIRRGALQEEVRSVLDRLGVDLVLPLLGKRDVLGFLLLGGKRSEEPYSASDAKLLGSVAAQTGLALENSRLTATVAQEVARRERMSREIEIARDVQTRLFPQRLPSLPGVDCAGACRPAQGVGGDYYDFLALPGGKLGVALGDVAGKGIPAALLMASLQASLRGQRLSGPSDLAHMMTNMNRLIFDSSPENRYATFFYGELDPATRRMDYVNAGHNAPMIFRSSGELERLKATGPVIGLVDGGRYEQRSTTLAPGDMLVVYSDGISEAMNTADEEWGEDKLAASVRERRDGTSQVLIAHLFEQADAFAAGAIQHDDMTLVVVRCE